ncbi:unnamed protein product [Kuraishia capsulata CBS 1993]|uniref:Kri1-like C-terminal domain-containing protein n=1 Tax=Kuraishia capsulata CBS 1993 TaxID=1382522 RepID=W6MG09_9ASCO|nr:uncharacterized protein KUCA_T00000324001 [Kuraishia capsulata CBS 1993]CDK24363.1 unnamed protein product [Kuraishia capsulata CBS 1993]
MPRKVKQDRYPVSNEVEESESSTSEEEDEFGDLVTDEVEAGISNVLQAIKTGDKKLFDSNVRFFEEPEKAVANLQVKAAQKPVYLKDVQRENILSGKPEKAVANLQVKAAQKPVYLKDVQRENILSGKVFQNEEEEAEEDKRTYVQQQREDKSQLLSEIKGAFSDDESDGEDNFLQQKSKPVSTDDMVKLPNPEVDGAGFLEAYVNSKAWISEKDEPVQLEEDDDEFEEAAEKFENAYNFRYEDANSAEIISYARNQATMRRSETNSRKKQRDRKKEEVVKEKQAVEQEISRKKLKKVNTVTDRLAKIKEAIGEDVDSKVVEKVFGDSLLADDFNDADWDAKMSEIFNQQYYEGDDAKPTWSDSEAEGEAVEEEPAESSKVSKKKQKKQEKHESKKSKSSLKTLAEKIVESNVETIRDEVEEERGRSKNEIKFRYREVSPDSFGLNVRDILMADDKQLNDFIKLKKFAPFKPREQRAKDKRKYAKKKRLREWRKEVFNDEEGPKIGEEGIPIPQEPERKRRRH